MEQPAFVYECIKTCEESFRTEKARQNKVERRRQENDRKRLDNQLEEQRRGRR